MSKRLILLMLGMIASFGVGRLIGWAIFSDNFYHTWLFILANLLGLWFGLTLMWFVRMPTNHSQNFIGLAFSSFYILGLAKSVIVYVQWNLISILIVCFSIAILLIFHLLIRKNILKKEGEIK